MLLFNNKTYVLHKHVMIMVVMLFQIGLLMNVVQKVPVVMFMMIVSVLMVVI